MHGKPRQAILAALFVLSHNWRKPHGQGRKGQPANRLIVNNRVAHPVSEHLAVVRQQSIRTVLSHMRLTNSFNLVMRFACPAYGPSSVSIDVDSPGMRPRTHINRFNLSGGKNLWTTASLDVDISC